MSAATPATGETFLRRVPADQNAGVEFWYPRWTVISVAESRQTSSRRSSLEESPMKYLPPVSFEASST
jgi:hypothetical protein